MRIGLVTPAWPGGSHANGITTSVFYLSQGLQAQGHEVTIISLNDEGLKNDRDRSVFILPKARKMTVLERAKKHLNLDEPFHEIIGEQIAAAVSEAARSKSIDVLIMEETHGWAKTVQELLPIPVIVVLHGPWFIQSGLQREKTSIDDRRREHRESLAIKGCAGVVGPSRSVLEMTLSEVPGINSEQAVIHNPILQKLPVCYDKLDEKQRKSILFVGRHDHRKGADTLFSGFARLVEQGADVFLTFIGPDPGLKQADGSIVFIPEALAALGHEVSSRITYLGACSGQEIDLHRQKHLLTVVTSRYETFGYTVLEALAAGSATISTAAGGPEEIIRDGETGLLIPPDDPAELANACMKLLNNPDLAASLGKAARVDVSKRFNPDVVAAALVDFSKKVVAGST
ncbi:Glycosyltransferase involved in cell wall bisynthesis [Ruegeria halocynthiae]|uniref:Glycosyltransferase involved in cell wall bisynthesis n=1 Tax=Ruegeria halocynthiae TaxID=985054 RepID=A0A1H3E1K0_9RHOB|nr:glycosyltransferase family 4 protein [Ruegeria halocynthiae]SDX72593.1 Glycosyltransferase involved in cell wall bisynthesis [Ruegeria halocynthiae]